jgi:hypothetical protein
MSQYTQRAVDNRLGGALKSERWSQTCATPADAVSEAMTLAIFFC